MDDEGSGQCEVQDEPDESVLGNVSVSDGGLVLAPDVSTMFFRRNQRRYGADEGKGKDGPTVRRHGDGKRSGRWEGGRFGGMWKDVLGE